jgi:2'-5' RNA ligase
MAKTFRAFIAVGLPEDVRRWLREARALLQGRIPSASVRWTNPNGIHITLKFLGEIPVESASVIRSAMEAAAAQRCPFTLVVEGLGCFPNAGRPRVIWAGVRREEALDDLNARLEEGLERIGFPKERRAFSPHLTLGRVREGVSPKELGEIGRMVTGAPCSPPIAMEVTGYSLFKSVLRPTGAEYSVQYRASFPPGSAGPAAG